MNAITRYFQQWTEHVGNAWNQFWFAPRDPYALSVLRIITGITTCWWFLVWTFDLQRMFGPKGLLPLETMIDWRGGRGIPLLDFAGNSTTLWIIHSLALVCAVMYTIGLFTRITSVLTAVFLISYLWRAPLLAGELEYMLAMLLVYLCVGPCGADLSVDKLRVRRKTKADLRLRPEELDKPLRSTTATISTRLIQVHVTAIFIMMALVKLRSAAWLQGGAVWWLAVRPDTRLIDLSGFLAGKLELVNFLTHAIVVFELSYAVMIWNRWTRPIAIGMSLLIWPLIAVLTGLLGFCWLMLTISLAFVSPEALRACISGCLHFFSRTRSVSLATTPENSLRAAARPAAVLAPEPRT